MQKHPAGLPFLFFTEMWERFGYYLMIGILMLYMTDVTTGGLGMDRASATDIYGTFIALVYVTPFIGGILADRILGYRLSIVIGGILMGLGYSLLYFPDTKWFFIALGLIILGNGFFKPNISVLLGNLYNEEKYSAMKDSGYSIFYMGINIGALVCNFVAAYLRNQYGWGYAFLAAGIGMFIGVGIFVMGWAKYAHADVIQSKESRPEGEMGVGALLSMVLLPAFITGYLGWIIPGSIFGSDSTDAFVFFTLPIIGFYLWTLAKAKPEDKKPIRALLSIYAVVIIFWAVFKQNGTALTTWAEFYTDRGVPTSYEPVFSKMGMMQEIKGDPAEYPVYDSQFRTTKGADGKPVKAIGEHPYTLNLPAEEKPAPGASLSVISTEIFQSVNPFFVIILTPVVIWFFSWMARRKREPGTPAKLGWGLFVSAISTLVMVWAAYACHNGTDKASAWWIVGTYAVVTIGELFLSPMGLSMVSKLAPRHLVGLMMGGWQLATAIGNKLSGVLAQFWDAYADKANFFWVNFGLLIVASGMMAALVPWLNRIFKEKNIR